MLQVTPRARDELLSMLTQAVAGRSQKERLCLRLVAANGDSELGLALDAPREGDKILAHEGRSVLIADSPTCDLLGDLTLDVVETARGARLGLRE